MACVASEDRRGSLTTRAEVGRRIGTELRMYVCQAGTILEQLFLSLSANSMSVDVAACGGVILVLSCWWMDTDGPTCVHRKNVRTIPRRLNKLL